jgi:hypothetical protein
VSRPNLPPDWAIVDGKLTPPTKATSSTRSRSSASAHSSACVSPLTRRAAAGLLSSALAAERVQEGLVDEARAHGASLADWQAARASVLAGDLPTPRRRHGASTR